MSESLRDQMPQTAALVDKLREVFGADTINLSIKAGMAGVPGKFWAREGGKEVGTR